MMDHVVVGPLVSCRWLLDYLPPLCIVTTLFWIAEYSLCLLVYRFFHRLHWSAQFHNSTKNSKWYHRKSPSVIDKHYDVIFSTSSFSYTFPVYYKRSNRISVVCFYLHFHRKSATCWRSFTISRGVVKPEWLMHLIIYLWCILFEAGCLKCH